MSANCNLLSFHSNEDVIVASLGSYCVLYSNRFNLVFRVNSSVSLLKKGLKRREGVRDKWPLIRSVIWRFSIRPTLSEPSQTPLESDSQKKTQPGLCLVNSRLWLFLPVSLTQVAHAFEVSHALWVTVARHLDTKAMATKFLTVHFRHRRFCVFGTFELDWKAKLTNCNTWDLLSKA